jgi:2-amino-4-hydroxy-6-hydroxymethyldihydropteridine diphosphokinase
MQKKVYLLLGSNLGDRAGNLRRASASLQESVGDILNSSSVYQTEPWGLTAQPAFLNQVIVLDCGLSAKDLLYAAKQIEQNLGRESGERWGPRQLDIDILFFGDDIIHEPDLVVPHPGIVSRRFTLVPLCEIAADFVHPALKKTCEQLLKECPDSLKVERW